MKIVGALLLGALALIFILFFFAPREDDTEVPDDNTRVVYIGSTRVLCTGVSLQRCYLIRENPNDQWQLFYDEIKGFDYEPGYEYQLEMQVTELDPAEVPADASTLSYELVEVLAKEPVPYVYVNSPEDFTILNANEPFTVTGSGRGLFENNVVIEIIDPNENLLVVTPTTMSTEEIGGEGTWSVEITLDAPVTQDIPALLTAFSPSPVDGNRNINYQVPIAFELEN